MWDMDYEGNAMHQVRRYSRDMVATIDQLFKIRNLAVAPINAHNDGTPLHDRLDALAAEMEMVVA